MSRTSVRDRYLTTLITNILRVGLIFISGLVIARSLGPGKYGDFNFLLGSFTVFATLVDMASSSAFYTFISQKKRGKKFFLYYTTWLLLQFIILLLFTLVLPVSFRQKIWLGHSGHLILFALLASFTMNQIWRFVGQIGESIRDTFGVQIRNLSLAASYLICVLVLSGLHVISIRNLFILNILSYFLFSALYARRIYQANTLLDDKRENFEGIFDEFKGYCSPLVIYTIIGFLYSFADYWLLQKFGGSVQQGYYAVGARFASLSLLATTSMLQVFWKEIAEANSLGNIKRVRLLYHRVSRSLYFIGAVTSCLLIPFSQEILILLLGQTYQAAWLPLSLMFLYPVHQSMGQITGTMLYATERTMTKSYIGLFFMTLSIPTAYFVLAPKTSVIPGINMGAAGLALKMISCQFIEVNLMAFFVARYTESSFDWLYQFYVLMLLLPLGFISKILTLGILSFIHFQVHVILVIAVSGFIYLAGVVIMLYHFPSIAGVNRDHINNGFIWLKGRIRFG